MSQPRIALEYPTELLVDYQHGRLTIAELADRLHVSKGTLRTRLRKWGVDTRCQIRKRGQFAKELEAAQQLETGSAYATVVELYREGLSTKQIAERLHMNNRTVALILARVGVKLRSMFCRSVFDGRSDDLPLFSTRLRSLRHRLGLTQQELGERAGFCQKAIWQLETGRYGPHWTTLYRLCEALDVEPEALGVTWEPEPLPLPEPQGDMASFLATSAGMSSVS